MRFTRLIGCDIYRDGGSYEAELETDTGELYALTLRIHAFDRGWSQYGGLFECALDRIRADSPPVPTASAREREILAALNDWIERNVPDPSLPQADPVARLLEMVSEIPGRNPHGPIAAT